MKLLTLEEMYAMQFAFQQRLDSKIGTDLEVKERNTQYRESCIFTIEEIIEGLQSINHKPWKNTPQEDDIDGLKDELIDEFRFFLNRCILVQMTPDEFSRRFIKSMEKTEKRLIDNY